MKLKLYPLVFSGFLFSHVAMCKNVETVDIGDIKIEFSIDTPSIFHLIFEGNFEKLDNAMFLMPADNLKRSITVYPNGGGRKEFTPYNFACLLQQNESERDELQQNESERDRIVARLEYLNSDSDSDSET